MDRFRRIGTPCDVGRVVVSAWTWRTCAGALCDQTEPPERQGLRLLADDRLGLDLDVVVTHEVTDLDQRVGRAGFAEHPAMDAGRLLPA